MTGLNIGFSAKKMMAEFEHFSHEMTIGALNSGAQKFLGHMNTETIDHTDHHFSFCLFYGELKGSSLFVDLEIFKRFCLVEWTSNLSDLCLSHFRPGLCNRNDIRADLQSMTMCTLEARLLFFDKANPMCRGLEHMVGSQTFINRIKVGDLYLEDPKYCMYGHHMAMVGLGRTLRQEPAVPHTSRCRPRI